MALRADGRRRCDWCMTPLAPDQLLPLIAVWSYHLGGQAQGNSTNLVCGECWGKMTEQIAQWKDQSWRLLPEAEKRAILAGDRVEGPTDGR